MNDRDHPPVAHTPSPFQSSGTIDYPATSGVELAACSQHRALLAAADRCESASGRYFAASPAQAGTRDLLTSLATEIRAATVVFALDPTLAQEPHSPRWRSSDILIELARQLPPLLRQAWDTTRGATTTDPIPQRWAEAVALHERAIEFARSIPDLVPRPAPTSPAGQRAISAERLATRARPIAEAAALLREAAALALISTNPDPRAVELDTIAARLDHIATDLEDLDLPDVMPRPTTSTPAATS